MKLLSQFAMVIALALTFSSARAGTIQVLEPTEGNTLWTVTIAGLPPGSGGNGVFPVTGTSEGISFSYQSNRIAGANQTFVGVLFEDPQFTQISDIMTITTAQGSSSVFISVQSDTETGLTFPTGITTRLLENGTYQNMATVTFADGTTDVISLQSDVAGVPEPGTVTLLGMGIACLGGCGWWRRKYTAA